MNRSGVSEMMFDVSFIIYLEYIILDKRTTWHVDSVVVDEHIRTRKMISSTLHRKNALDKGSGSEFLCNRDTVPDERVYMQRVFLPNQLDGCNNELYD